MEVDKRVTTRGMSRKLHDECGINEKDILYQGLDYHGTESRVSKELRELVNCDFEKNFEEKTRFFRRFSDLNGPKISFLLAKMRLMCHFSTIFWPKWT